LVATAWSVQLIIIIIIMIRPPGVEFKERTAAVTHSLD
jgi:hypothetical protein